MRQRDGGDLPKEYVGALPLRPCLRDIRRRAQIFDLAVGGPALAGLANLKVCHLPLEDPVLGINNYPNEE